VDSDLPVIMRPISLVKQLAAASLLFLGADAAAVKRSGASSCPGYKASNVQLDQGQAVGADLNLAGAACNVYGTDLDNLKLVVEYQTSMSGRALAMGQS
jgi:alpha-glucosidase